MTATPHRLHRLGADLHAWTWGPGGGPWVVLSHGALMDHRMFDLQVPPLVEAGYRVLAWDLRGHGRSRPAGDRLDVRVLAEDLLALLDLVGAHGPVVLVGQSLGGYVSQELLYREPDRVRGLVALGAVSLTAPLTRLEAWGLRAAPAMFAVWPREHLRRTVARSTAVTTAAREYAHEVTGHLDRREVVAVWSAVATAMRPDRDYRVPCPVLVVHGEHDRTGVVARRSPEWAARDPGVRFEVVPGAGHNANQDAPERFDALLLDFLRDLS